MYGIKENIFMSWNDGFKSFFDLVKTNLGNFGGDKPTNISGHAGPNLPTPDPGGINDLIDTSWSGVQTKF